MKNKRTNLDLFGEHEDAAVNVLTEVSSEYPYIGSTDAREVAKLAQLIRIADALESISSSLGSIDINLEALSDCTTENPNGSRSMMTVVSGGIQID